MQFLKHSVFVLSSFAFVYVWERTTLSFYTLPLLGFLIFLYIVLSVKAKRIRNHIETGGTPTVLLLNTAILLFIFSTQGLNSPLFFLLYFVLFGIAFVFEPAVVFVYAVATTLLFYQQTVEGDIMNNLLQVASLFLIAPLAFFFGREYKNRSQQDNKIDEIKETSQKAADVIEQDATQLLNDPAIPDEGKEKLEEVIEETENLKEKTK